jgi:aldehyde dehydrogenase (NAD+)
MICFTGSTQKGKLVAAAAGQNLVPCLLELGGKSPAIVDESANLDLAAKKIVFGKFVNAG